MQSEKYIEEVIKTRSSDYDAIKERLNDPAMIDMLHAAIGMVTESAELIDMLKKHIFYGKDLDLVNMVEELGDMDWYESLCIHAMRLKKHSVSWEAIWEKNIEKLRLRYEGKFSKEKAIERDLEAERELLERAPQLSISCCICEKRPNNPDNIKQDSSGRIFCQKCFEDIEERNECFMCGPKQYSVEIIKTHNKLGYEVILCNKCLGRV